MNGKRQADPHAFRLSRLELHRDGDSIYAIHIRPPKRRMWALAWGVFVCVAFIGIGAGMIVWSATRSRGGGAVALVATGALFVIVGVFAAGHYIDEALFAHRTVRHGLRYKPGDGWYLIRRWRGARWLGPNTHAAIDGHQPKGERRFVQWITVTDAIDRPHRFGPCHRRPRLGKVDALIKWMNRQIAEIEREYGAVDNPNEKPTA